MLKQDNIVLYSEESANILKLRDSINHAIERLDKEHPEWRNNLVPWQTEEDIDGTSTLVLCFKRNMTPEEEEILRRKHDFSVDREKETLKRLMERYPEEVQNILKNR